MPVRETEIILGESVFVVRRMPATRAIAWRKRSQPILEQLVALEEKYKTEQNSLYKAGLLVLAEADGLVEAMLDAVLECDASLKTDPELRDRVYEEELLEAFGAVVALNAPLASMLDEVTAPGVPSPST